MATKAFDVIIYGATGFTGELVAEYFAQNIPQSSTSWAVAARSTAKLQQLVAKLSATKPELNNLTCLVAHTGDTSSLDRMCQQARVLINCVGPYRFHGEPVVRACLNAGTDYVDVTGEPQYIRTLFANYADEAKEKNVLIVPCCGVDSIPADLGVYVAKKHLTPDTPATINAYIDLPNGLSKGSWHGVSNGTWTTLVNGLASSHSASGAGKREGKQPTPSAASSSAPAKSTYRTPKGQEVNRKPHYEKTIGKWVLPLAVADPLIVKLTHDLTAKAGVSLRYGHFLQCNNFFSFLRMSVAFVFLFLATRFSFFTSLLLKAKGDGYGPSKEERQLDRTELMVRGKDDAGKQVAVSFSGIEVYELTAILVAQCALAALKDRKRLPRQSGVLTPAAAFGDVLVERLEQAGVAYHAVQL